MQDFGDENNSKELAFQAAITAVNQAASEQELDERVGSALSSLDGSAPSHAVRCSVSSTRFPNRTANLYYMLCIATSIPLTFQSSLECVHKLAALVY